MFHPDFLSAIAYETISAAETADGEVQGLGEIVRLEIELQKIDPPVIAEGRKGKFIKLKVEYQVLVEFEKDVEAKETPEAEIVSRSIRLSEDGKVLAVSDRI